MGVLIGIIIGSISSTGTGWAESKGNIKNGRARFEQYCAVCHGPRGKGDGPMAKATSPPAPSLGSSDVRSMTDEALLAVIADGKGAVMPGWRGLLNDQELLDVVAYVRSLSG